VRLILACAWVQLLSCRPSADEQFARAQKAYAEAVHSHRREAEGAAVAALESIESSSPHFRSAQRLLAELQRSRPVVPPPIAFAVKANGALPDVVKAQLAKCVALASAVGRDGGLTEESRESLRVCQSRAYELFKAAEPHE
jgi:hypothetical protein